MSRSPTLALSPEQAAAFTRDGFLRVECPLTTDDELTWFRGEYDRLFAAHAGRDVGDHFDLAGPDEAAESAALPQMLAIRDKLPALADTLLLANGLAVARALLGPEAQWEGDHAILKPARVGAATPWHQDEAYWDPGLEFESLSIWVPLQDVGPHNGCMCFVPGSHQGPVRPHQPIGDDPRVHGLELAAGPPEQAAVVECPLPAGGYTVHHCRTLHATAPNPTGGARRAYTMCFGLPNRRRERARRFPWLQRRETARQKRADGAAYVPDAPGLKQRS